MLWEWNTTGCRGQHGRGSKCASNYAAQSEIPQIWRSKTKLYFQIDDRRASARFSRLLEEVLLHIWPAVCQMCLCSFWSPCWAGGKKGRIKWAFLTGLGWNGSCPPKYCVSQHTSKKIHGVVCPLSLTPCFKPYVKKKYRKRVNFSSTNRAKSSSISGILFKTKIENISEINNTFKWICLKFDDQSRLMWVHLIYSF